MALTDLFTGAPGIQAAQNQRQFLGNLMGNENWNFGRVENQGLSTLAGAQANQLGTLVPAYQQAEATLGGSIPQQIGAITGYGTGAINALTGGNVAGAGALAGGLGAWDPVSGLAGSYANTGQSYTSTIQDALGLNGPEGVARAQSAFTQSPGYQWQLGQGLEAINRARNMSGQLVGGNTDRAAQDYGAGLASQQWNNWINQLTGQQGLMAPLGLQGLTSAAGGMSGLYTSLANLLNQGGQGVANILGGMGTNISNVLGGGATNLANLITGGAGAESGVYGTTAQQQTNLLQALAQAQAGFTQNMAQPYANTYTTQANAQLGGANNLMSLLSGIGGALLRPGPTGGLGATLGGQLGSAALGGLGSLGSSLMSALAFI